MILITVKYFPCELINCFFYYINKFFEFCEAEPTKKPLIPIIFLRFDIFLLLTEPP